MNDILDDVEEEVVSAEKDRKSLVKFNSDRDIDTELKDEYIYATPDTRHFKLPKGIAGLHGCMHCDWADTKECNYLDSNGMTKPPVDKICIKKDKFLKLFSRKAYYKSIAEWQRDFNLSMLNKEILHNYTTMNRLNRELNDYIKKGTGEVERGELEFKDYRKLVMSMQKEITGIKGQWLDMLYNSVKYDDKQVDRDTPKQINIDSHQTLDLTSINNIIRGKHLPDEKVVDTDYEEVKNE